MSEQKPTLEHAELLIWTIMKKLEQLALEQYKRFAPNLPIESKNELVSKLEATAPLDETLETSELAAGIDKVLEEATGNDADHTLCVQGLILEQLGKTIYGALHANETLSQTTKQLSKLGTDISSRFTEFAGKELLSKYPDGDMLFNLFAQKTKSLLNSLDSISGGIDKVFADRLNLRFSDLIGDFTAEILPMLSELGMNRRKVVCHLTGSFMGM